MPRLALICGRYEGVDERVAKHLADEEFSIGDFVLSGGEIAAMALLDAVARLQPGVLNDEGSHQFDSFNPALDGLLKGLSFEIGQQAEAERIGTVLAGEVLKTYTRLTPVEDAPLITRKETIKLDVAPVTLISMMVSSALEPLIRFTMSVPSVLNGTNESGFSRTGCEIWTMPTHF